MGQGYIAVILNTNGAVIRTWLNPHEYGNGYKLMEHSYINNRFVSAVESLLSKEGMFYKSRVLWAGDYADNEFSDEEQEQEQITNINAIAGSLVMRQTVGLNYKDMSAYRYIVNHTKKLYVDKNLELEHNLHPLPLLTAEGNGRGGGDYEGSNMELIGSWARDIISLEIEPVKGYMELECGFGEK